MTIDDLTYDPEIGIFNWKETGKIAGGATDYGYNRISFDGKSHPAGSFNDLSK
jgi:hypothetical protein